MQKAETVLTILNQKSKSDKAFTFKRLYRNLFNPSFFLNAYAKIYNKEGNMTKGVDGKTIDGFGMKRVNKLIHNLEYERFEPQPVRRKYIPKKNDKMRPLGIPTVEDKLVQELLRQILEAIYEPLFSENSHGFRPNRSCHTALQQITKTCNGCSWVIEGDIKGFFDNIDHEILLEILSRKIDDGRFINLIRKFLKSGIMEEGLILNPITGTPQGGIISPLLANIYLNELDHFMEMTKLEIDCGTRRKDNKQYTRLSYLKHRELKKGNIFQAKELNRQMKKISSVDNMDSNFRRIKYVRYADDFLILIHGSKALATELKNKVAQLLSEKLHLELSPEKTLITNPLKDKVRFLGYDILKGKSDSKISITRKGIKRRSLNGSLQLLVPSEVINDKIKKFTNKGKPSHVKERLNLTPLEIMEVYNAEIRGMYNYYSLAHNVAKRLNKYQYYHYYSLVSILSYKYKISNGKIIKKFGIPVKRRQEYGTWNIVGIKYKTKKGEKILTYFNEPLKRKYEPRNEIKIPDEYIKNYKNELIRRLLNGRCDLCNNAFNFEELEVHHIRNLKRVKEKYRSRKEDEPKWLKLMTKIRRKTLITCNSCHKNIHRS